MVQIAKQVVSEQMKSVGRCDDLSYSDEVKDAIKKKIDSITSDHMNFIMSGLIDKHLNDLSIKLQHLSDTVRSLQQTHPNVRLVRAIGEMTIKNNSVMERVLGVEKKVNSFIEGKVIQTVSNAELQELYLNSGLKLENIATKFSVDKSTAHRWVNGENSDPHVRHKLKMFLVECISQKTMVS